MNENTNTALVPTCQDIEVMATEPGEMLPTQNQLIDWCRRKCAALEIVTGVGEPEHPLYMPADQPLTPFRYQ